MAATRAWPLVGSKPGSEFSLITNSLRLNTRKHTEIMQHTAVQSGANAIANSAIPMLAGVRIIITMLDLELGGAERQALTLALHLRDQENAQVEIWGLGGNEGIVSRICEDRGIPWRLMPLPWFTGRKDKAINLARLTLALKRARPDVILSYLTIPNVACGLIWRWTGARACIWNQRCAGIDRVGERAERTAVKRVPWFASNSQAGADFLVNKLNAPAERVRVVHNAIRLPAPQMDRAAWRGTLGLSADTVAVCMVANLTVNKDHVTMLHAWQHVIEKLNAEGRSAVLLLAGRDTEGTLDKLKILAFDLGFGRSVRFLGQVKDVSGLLNAVDLCVLSSRSESSPNGVLEAMAAGLAVAGTDNSGIREALGPEGYEYLAPTGDAEALANRILNLTTDADLRARIARANKARIEREFNPDITCGEMTSLIIDALKESHSQKQTGLSPANDELATSESSLGTKSIAQR
jgi:glycosyltransferase involved in cell wall biosynthesis